MLAGDDGAAVERRVGLAEGGPIGGRGEFTTPMGGSGFAGFGNGGGGGAAAGGDAVVGAEIGVAEDGADFREREAEFFGDGHGEFGGGALAHVDFAGVDGDGAVSGEGEAGAGLGGGLGVEEGGGR